jgi:hypothetical protein
MKMINGTNITSTRGVTLISDIGARRERPLRFRERGLRPSGFDLQLAAQSGVKAVGEAAEARFEAVRPWVRRL